MSAKIKRRIQRIEQQNNLVTAEKDNLVMRINGKEYRYSNIAEGNQALIKFSREAVKEPEEAS